MPKGITKGVKPKPSGIVVCGSTVYDFTVKWGPSKSCGTGLKSQNIAGVRPTNRTFQPESKSATAVLTVDIGCA